MNVVELICREHAAIAQNLQHYVDSEDPGVALHVGRQALARTRAWVLAEERVLFPAVIAVTADLSPLPLAQHAQIKACVAQASSCDGQHDVFFVRPMLRLQQQMRRYARLETSELSAHLARIFDADELRQLRGALLLELAPVGSFATSSSTLEKVPGLGPRSLFAPWRSSRGAALRKRAVPTLRAAVQDEARSMSARPYGR